MTENNKPIIRNDSKNGFANLLRAFGCDIIEITGKDVKKHKKGEKDAKTIV